MRVHVVEHVEEHQVENEAREPSGTRAQQRRYRSSWTGGSVLLSGDATPAATFLPDPGDVVWQWEHRTGFKNYDLRATARIEDAFQRGLSRVRLKAGKMDDTPMELFFHDMIQFDPKTGNTREIRRIGHDTIWQKLRRKANEITRLIETGRTQRVVFAQYEQRRRELHKGMDRPDYNVCNLYNEKGCCQAIAKSNTFFLLSMIAVLVNSVWIGLEADANTGTTLSQAPVGYQAIEHCFCAIFSLEIVIRFGAFKRKRDSIRDGWFCFDSALVAMMIGEVWVLPIVILMAGLSNDSGVQAVRELTILRLVRLLRLTRLGRIARLLRAVPEVLTLLKGIAAAMRSVFFTLLLLLVLLFVFGVVFKTQAKEDFPELNDLFPSVPAAMWLLLLSGTFLDSPSVALNEVGATSAFLAALFLIFIFLSSFMVLNMLIGILCDVVHQVALNEKEEAAVAYLKSTLLEILECHDKDNDRQIHRDEFELLMRNPEMHFVLTRFGVNVVDLITLKDVLFEDKDASLDYEDAGDETPSPVPTSARALRKLSFCEFLEVVLRLRGGNSATVTDIVDLREYVRQRFDRMDLRVLQNAMGTGVTGSPVPLRTLRSMKSLAVDRYRNVLNEVPEADSEEASQEQPQPPTERPSPPGELPTLLREGVSSEESGAQRAQLPKVCLPRPSAGQPSGQSVTETLLVKLAELSAGQQEMATRQTAWRQDVTHKQAELAGQLRQVHDQLHQVQNQLAEVLKVTAGQGKTVTETV